MKRILEFNIPEDIEEYEIAVRGNLYKRLWIELEGFLRKKRKYEDQESILIDDLVKEMVNLEREYLQGEQNVKTIH